VSEKPLNVRVAEALGHTVQDVSRYGCRCSCVGLPGDNGAFPMPRDPRTPHDHIEWEYWRSGWDDDGDWFPVEQYDSDWRVTGPLIHRFNISVHPGRRIDSPDWETLPKVWYAQTNLDGWGDPFPWGTPWEDAPFNVYGCGTPLEVVCELICNLAAAGKLPK
jgi:hypothetical protein